MTGLPIPAAAVALDISPATLRRWIASGAPVARRGRRGRGKSTLINPAAIAAWRRSEGGEGVLLAFSARVPEILARAASEAFDTAAGNWKQQSAATIATSWYLMANAVLDDLRTICPEVAEIASFPPEVERLRKIARK